MGTFQKPTYHEEFGLRRFFKVSTRTIVLVSLFSIAVLSAYGLSVVLNSGLFGVHAHEGEAQVHFWIDRGWITLSGDCTVIRWQVDYIQAVYFDEQGVTGSEARQYCPDAEGDHRLRVILTSGQERFYKLDPRVPFLGIKGLGSLALLLGLVGLTARLPQAQHPSPTRERTSERAIYISVTSISLSISGLLLVTLLLHFGLEDNALGVILKLVCASLALGIMPGILTLLGLDTVPQPSLFDLVGLGLPISIGFVQALTVISIVFHISSQMILAGYFVVILMTSLVITLSSRRGQSRVVRLPHWQIFIGLLLVGLACVLYIKGSPFLSDENQIHVSIVRRLASISAPALNNLYTVPGIVYTNPLPGTHYFMALLSRLSGLDPLFVYHKLRFLWGPVSIVILALIAKHLFRREALAAVTALVAILFVLNGTFADVPGVYWAQLAPYSHPSDVPINVYLPGLILLSFSFFEADNRRANVGFFGACLLVALLVTCAHVREIVQMLVYLGSFLVALILFQRDKVYLLKAVCLIMGITAIVLAYVLWQKSIGASVISFDQTFKVGLADTIRGLAPSDYLAAPWQGLVPVWSVFYGWIPFMLLASPVIFLAYYNNRLMLFAGMSVFVFLLIIRFPLFSIPYIYLTVFEILTTPARNISIFVYLSAGAVFYLLAIHIARLRSRAKALLGAFGLSLAIAWLWFWASPVLSAQHDFAIWLIRR